MADHSTPLHRGRKRNAGILILFSATHFHCSPNTRLKGQLILLYEEKLPNYHALSYFLLMRSSLAWSRLLLEIY